MIVLMLMMFDCEVIVDGDVLMGIVVVGVFGSFLMLGKCLG